MGDPFIQITNKDIWDKLLHLEADLVELLGGQRLQNGKLAEHDETIRINAERVRSLEFKFYGVVAGFAAGLIYLITNGGTIQ